MTQINLLPWREQARRAKKMRFGFSILTCIGAALIFVIVIHLYFDEIISLQDQRNVFLQSALDDQGSALMMLNKKKKQQNVLAADLNFIFSLKQRSYRAVEILDELPRVVSEGVAFKKIIRVGEFVIIIGRAKSNFEITLLMKKIDASRIFKQPELTEITAKETSGGEERYFQLKVEQKG